jgi:hypothetical protein
MFSKTPLKATADGKVTGTGGGGGGEQLDGLPSTHDSGHEVTRRLMR